MSDITKIEWWRRTPALAVVRQDGPPPPRAGMPGRPSRSRSRTSRVKTASAAKTRVVTPAPVPAAGWV
jgi:hypothetical protein